MQRSSVLIQAKFRADPEKLGRLNRAIHELFKIASELGVGRGELVSYMLDIGHVDSLYFFFSNKNGR